MSAVDDQPEPTGGGGRHAKPDDFPAIFAIIATGRSLRAACRELRIHYPTTHAAMSADRLADGLWDQYARAREERGDALAEQVIAISQAVLRPVVPAVLDKDGRVITPAVLPLRSDQARVAMEGLKWAAARMAPKTWGDKSEVAVTGPNGSPVITIFRLPDNQRQGALPAPLDAIDPSLTDAQIEALDPSDPGSPRSESET